MKKVRNDFLECFKERFSWLLNKKWQFLLVFILTSCSVQNKVNKDDYLPISRGFSGIFYDRLDTISSNYDARINTRSLMKDLTNIEDIDYLKPIHIDLNQKEMYLSFETIHMKKYVVKFYGKRHKNRFVFYTNYKTISFPILFISKEVEKFEINFPTENEIVFESKSVNEGMFLLFGAGNSSKSDYKFKLIRNE